MINIIRTGHILYVNNYCDCVDFYKDKLQLPILFQQEQLTCFDFYGTYLMIEQEDRKDYLQLKKPQKNFSCIRINVSDVQQVAILLSAKNINVDYNEYPWGKTAKFYDPDGNLLAFKDEEGFLKQLQEYRHKND